MCVCMLTCPLNKALTQHEGKDVYRVGLGHPKLFGATIIKESYGKQTRVKSGRVFSTFRITFDVPTVRLNFKVQYKYPLAYP